MTITARVETAINLTPAEHAFVAALATAINDPASELQHGLGAVEPFLQRHVSDRTGWTVYRGGSHIALLRADDFGDKHRVLLVEERRPEPEPLTDYVVKPIAEVLALFPTPTVHAPVAARPDVEVGETFLIHINQGDREAEVLAVRGDRYLVEYDMPKGTTALQVFRVGQDSGTSVSYRGLSQAWLRALVEAESEWKGVPQGNGGRRIEQPAQLLQDRADHRAQAINTRHFRKALRRRLDTELDD